jgi:virginiamycin B lyase
VWATVFDVPLTRIDTTTNKVVMQWIGKGGDSLRFGHGSIWLTDDKKGLLSRFPAEEVLNH